MVDADMAAQAATAHGLATKEGRHIDALALYPYTIPGKMPASGFMKDVIPALQRMEIARQRNLTAIAVAQEATDRAVEVQSMKTDLAKMAQRDKLRKEDSLQLQRMQQAANMTTTRLQSSLAHIESSISLGDLDETTRARYIATRAKLLGQISAQQENMLNIELLMRKAAGDALDAVPAPGAAGPPGGPPGRMEPAAQRIFDTVRLEVYKKMFPKRPWPPDPSKFTDEEVAAFKAAVDAELANRVNRPAPKAGTPRG